MDASLPFCVFPPPTAPMRSAARFLTLLSALAAASCAHAPRAPSEGGDGETLRAFRSEGELVRFQRELARAAEKEGGGGFPGPPPPAPPPPPPPPPPSSPGAAPAPVAVAEQEIVVTGAAGADEVTNVQHAGVDEGGIVKVHGDHLVVLRRGRLFTVRFGGGALEPVAAVDAFGPGIDPDGAWYDEMLVADGLVAVIGYSYARGGTEVGLFRIDSAGGLAHRATYQLRSDDYYSSRNYASRLVEGKLVFYAPISFDPYAENPLASFPAVRRWGTDPDFRPTADATRVYRAAGPMGDVHRLALHSVTVCDPDDERLRCRSTVLFGPEGRVFYVSPTAVYLWTTQDADGGRREATPRSMLYRMPLDGSAPTGLRVLGAPVNQLSFLESGDGHLNALVRSEARGEGMWRAEVSRGDVALLRVPVSSFGDGSGKAPDDAYRPLPRPGRGAFQNRFVGDWVIYGVGGGWGRAREGGSTAYAAPWAHRGGAHTLRLPHSLERIEAMGSGAVLVGSADGDLHFSGVRLGERAELAHRYVRRDAAQGETRTHGFFYRADGEEEGVLGLPIRGGGTAGYEHLVHGSASVLFLRNEAFRLTELGDLAASPEAGAEDGCRASCVDWYGNARPLFLRGRVFALLGYEIVEGAERGGRIREVRRVDFTPAAPPAR